MGDQVMVVELFGSLYSSLSPVVTEHWHCQCRSQEDLTTAIDEEEREDVFAAADAAKGTTTPVVATQGLREAADAATKSFDHTRLPPHAHG